MVNSCANTFGELASQQATAIAAAAIREHRDSILEIYQSKCEIQEKIVHLEQLVQRLKSLVLVGPTMANANNNNNNSSTVPHCDPPPAKCATEVVSTGMFELRTILADIDQHLSMLKDVEQRHALICETYSREICAREETLQAKIRQINQMNQELATMQSKILELSTKNQQLELEIKYIKTSSSITNTETSTPVNQETTVASTAGQSSRTSSQGNVANNELMVKLNRIRVQQHSDLFRPTAELASGEAKPITEIDYRKLYFELMKQYKQIETLLASENTLTQQTSETTIKVLDVEEKNGLNEKQEEPEVIHIEEEVAIVEDKTVEPPVASTVIQEVESNGVEEEEEAAAVNGLEGKVDNDVVATSIKAYEHFVKMQHDLETLMKNEERSRARIDELEKLNNSIVREKEEDEFRLSEVQYELDILKHNYNLEIESFGTAINERESLIEKLQQKVESLKKRYVKLDERLKTSIETEVEYKSSIEEFEGRLKYEQIQKQTVIDARVAELESRLEETEAEYQLEVKNLKTDLACQVSVEKDLRSRIEELENTVKTLGTPEFEEEFVYYKNQIDSLVKQLDGEKQEKQRVVDGFEEEIRSRDKQIDAIRESARKDKDSLLREKTEAEQRFRKLNARFKVKDREIQSLQEKLHLLNEKFRNYTIPTSVPKQQQQEGGESEMTPSVEQLMTESALNEMKITELNGELEDRKEQIEQLNETLNRERERRRQLETHYLGSINHRNVVPKDFPNQVNHYHRSDHEMYDSHYHNHGSFNRRNSVSSLALMMDDNEKQPGQQSLYNNLARSIRRQKNILLFGSFKAKLLRIFALVYLFAVHYFIIDYYFH